MKSHWLNKRLWLPQPREKVFEFFSDPGNLDRLTPAWLKFEILTALPAAMKRGTLLDYRLRIRGLPIRWQSEITEWDPPQRFVDRQTRGPYSLWIHEHRFEDCEDGTLVGDNVEYAVPGGVLVQRFFVAPDLNRIFAYRHQILEQLFNPAKSKPGGVSVKSQSPD
jgi:ligand-binding SRPBCC domain-containing protein